MRERVLRRFTHGVFHCVCVLSALLLASSAVAATDKPWNGKRVAILGDSYSTFNDGKTPTPGYSPIGGKYYPDSSKSVGLTLNQMWYQQVVADLGGTIVTNCSWGSSCIITNRYKAKTSEYIHSFEHRARDLPKINFTTGKPESTANGGFNGLKGCNPDVVIVMGGLNDEWQGSIQTSPNTYVEVTPALLKSRAKQLFKAVNSLCPHASEKYFVVLNDSLHATGFSTSKDFRKVLIEAVNETSGWTLIDHGYAQMAKSDFNSDSHINLSGHTKYAKNVIATVRGTVGKDSVLWTGNDGAWTTGSNWSGGKKPTGISAVHFPSNKTLKVTVSGSNLSKDAMGSTLTIGRGSSVLFTETATSGYVENWFNALQPYTFLEQGATAALEKPKAGAKDNEVYLDGTSILFESDTTFKTYKGAKFKVTGATFQNPVTKKWSDNITLISDGGATGVYLASNRSDGKVYLENDNFVVQSINYGTVSYTKGPWVYFNVPGRRTTQICRGGSTIFGPNCQISNGAVATLESSGTGGGKGSSLQLGSLNGLGAGSSITVKDGANMMVGYQFILGQYATTLNMSGASPLVEVTNGTGELNLSGGLTWKLRPLSTWSATAGRINVVGSKSKATVGADVKYEIDVSDIVPLTTAKKFCLVAATNKTSTAKRTLNLPAAGNVTLTGTSAGDYKATFTKDTYRMYVTIEPAPKQEAVGGWEKEYTAAGVKYKVVAFTNAINQTFSWTVPTGVSAVDLLVVGGGGAGGGVFKTGNDVGTGGGGAGGFIYEKGLAVTAGSVFTVKVGAGGTATTTASNNGEPSQVSNSKWTKSYVAGGGGAGGSFTVQGATAGNAGTAGASGGGGCGRAQAGGAANGQGAGHAGGIGYYATWSSKERPQGAGGGGADLCGTSPTGSGGSGGSGGMGKWCDITGTMLCYAGGGAGMGGTDNEKPGSSGTCDGGGAGAPGTDGLGGGGGGVNSESVRAGHRGGSGTVIIRYVVSMDAEVKPTNLSPNGKTLDLHNETQLAFFHLAPAARAIDFDTGDRATLSKQGDCLPKPITFSWTGGGKNTVTIKRADGTTFLTREVVGTSTVIDGFEIGTNYTWTVRNSKGESAAAAFSTSAQAPRLLREPRFVGATLATRKIGSGIVNIREPGGMVGLEGKRVKPNLLFRTAALNRSYARATDPTCQQPGETYVNNAEEDAFWHDFLKIKTEVDLRDPDEYGVNATESALGPTVEYVKFPTNIGDGQHCPCYGACFTADGKQKVKRVLDVVMDPTKYPLVYHCSGGQDRTGSLAYVLELILGVDDETATLDWECLALYSNSQSFPTYSGNFTDLHNGIFAYPGANMSEKAVAFVKDCGVNDEQITTFRNAMLEGGWAPTGAHVHQYGTWTTNVAATCTGAGEITCTCIDSCPDSPPAKLTQSIPALGHSWGAWTTNIVPRVGVEGERQRTCSRCGATEEEALEPLPSETHPYTVTWTGAAGDGKWATAGNFDKPTATNDYYVIPQDATITMEKATPGASLTVAAGKTLTVNGTTTLPEFTWKDGAEQYTVLEDGATLIARHKAGFRLTDGAGVYIGNNTTLRAENGCYMKISKLTWGSAENVKFEADGPTSNGQTIKIETPEAYGLSPNSSISFSAVNGGVITIGGGWNTCPWLDNGTPTLIAENGGKIGGVRVFKTPSGGARVSIGANSSVSVSGKTSTSEDGEFALGIGDELDLHGENPQLQIGGMDTVMTLGSGALVKLTPESSWSATEGRIRTTSAAAILSIGSGVAYEIDVSKISGGIADGASKTFCLASTISGVERPQILAGSENVTLVGEGASRFTCEFSTTEVTVSGKSYKTPSALKITLTASVPLVKTAAPTAATGLKYTGSAQTGVASGANYDLDGDVSATDAGVYVATATPKAGFCWNDGTTSPIEIEWSIAQADNSWTTPPSVSPTSFEAGKAGAVTLNVGKSKFGTPTANYDAGQIAALPAGTHTVTVSVPETDNWKGLTESFTITVTGSTAHEHTWGAWTLDVAPTFKDAGSQTHVCTECHESETVPVPAVTVPSGYEAADWVESTAQQYIDTGIKVQPNVKSDTAFTFTALTNRTFVMGTYRYASNKYTRFYLAGVNTSPYEWYAGGQDTYESFDTSVIPTATVGTRYRVVSTITATNQTITVNGRTGALACKVYANDHTAYLFARRATSNADCHANARVEFAHIYTNGTVLARSYLPARRTSDGVYGMWEAVSGTFKVSASSTPLYGPKVKKPTAKTGLVYTGKSQTGVATGFGYTLSGTTKSTNASSSFTATATLTEGHVWEDGTSAPLTITWSMAKATNSWTTQPSISPTTFEQGAAGVTFVKGAAKFGTMTATYSSLEDLAALTPGNYEQKVSVANTGNYTGLSKTISFTVTSDAPTHPYVVTWTGAAGDQKWATQGNWDKEWTSADTVRFNTDATAVVATTTPGAALMIESGKTVTIKGTAGVTAEFTGATESYQAMGDGATLILDGGTGIRMENAGIRFGNDTTYRVINGCYSKISGLVVGDSKNVRFETDASHLKFDLASALSAGSEIVCRTENANGLLELGTATLTAGTVTLVSENCATNSASDLQDNDAVVSLSIGTNAVFRVSSGEDHLFHLGATAGSTLDFHGPNPKVQLSYCNSVKLGANLTVRLTPEAGWNNWTLIQKSSDNTSTAGTCTIASGVHYVIDTSALADVKNELSFFLYNNGKTSDAHNIAVPAAGNVQLTGLYAAGFEATFSKPDNYKLKITLKPKQVTQPMVDGEPVAPADVFTKANSQKSTIVYPDNSVTVSGTTPAQKIVFSGTTVAVPAYYTATKSGATVTIAFNGREKPVVADGEGDTKAIVVGETSVSIHVGNAYDTLWYRLLKATDLQGDWAPVGEFTKAQADFTATRAASESAAFYKVEVTDIQPAK